MKYLTIAMLMLITFCKESKVSKENTFEFSFNVFNHDSVAKYSLFASTDGLRFDHIKDISATYSEAEMKHVNFSVKKSFTGINNTVFFYVEETTIDGYVHKTDVVRLQ